MEGVKAVIDEPNRGIPSEDTQIEVIRELRDLPPLHYLFKIKNFSQLYNGKIDNYDSSDFEVGGYQWRLSLYPKGNKKVNEKDHISLYLVLSESNSFPLYREVNVYLKLFIYNQIQDKYLTVQDAKGSVRRFRGMKKEWGFDQLVPLSVFNDASNGYLINDCCVFGAEVFVLEGCCKVECASAVKELDNNRYAWKFENFAELEEETYFSKDIRGLSAYLNLEDTDALDPRHSLYVEYLLRVRDQIKRKHHEQFEGNIFSSDDDGSGTWGFPALIPLTKLYDKKQGYIVNGAMILEVQISLITEVVNVQAKARSSTKQQFPFSRTSSEMGSNNFILNETVNEERYPKGWVIGKKRKVVNVDVDERIGVEEMNRKDGEIVDGLNDLQFQLVQERSKRAEVERENAVLQDRVSMLMNMLQENKKLDDQP